MAVLIASGATATLLAPSGGGASLTTLGNQERQEIPAANEWVEGNIDFWLESHLYDAQVRLDAGSSPSTVPSAIDVAMSFFFAEKNAIVIDWTQDWHVTLKTDVMFYTKNSAPPGAPFKCSTPPNIVDIPVGGRSIQVPQDGSICIQDVAADTTGDPATGWVNLMGLALADLDRAVPRRNEPCSFILNGLCGSGLETEANPAKEHYFRISLVSLFGPGGLYPQTWWPNLPAGQSIAVYFRNHLALTAIWKTAIGGPGGGSQAPFCIQTGPGMIRNTNFDRCSWTTVSRDGAGSAQGSKNHGTVRAPGIGSKTIPLPQVVAPTGFINVCKIVTQFPTDREGRFGTLTNGWTVHVEGPFGTSMTETTGSDGTGCSRFGPLFPAAGYLVSETVKPGFVHIGTVVVPPENRNGGSGTNPEPANPVNVSLTFAQAQAGTGPTVTFVNLQALPRLMQECMEQIRDATGALVSRGYAIAGDTVTFTFTVTNTGNVALDVVQTHTNTARFGPNPLFEGRLGGGESNTESRTTLIVVGDAGTISDTAEAVGTFLGIQVFADPVTCSVLVREPRVTFEKHPVASDDITTVPGAKVTYTISVENSGDAPATVTVADALSPGQTLLNGGADTAPGDEPSPAATSPAAGADYAGPVTIEWSGFVLDAGASITFTFRVKVTSTVDGGLIGGTATVVAVNDNGVDYSPSPNTAENAVTVHRPIVKLSEFGYTNSPDGNPTQGVVNGTTVYTIRFTNYGTAAAVISGSLTVTVTGAGSGTFSCSGIDVSDCVLTFSDVVVPPSETVTFTLTLVYVEMADGAVVSAVLAATYVTDGSGQTYVPSGVPARIEFTIQAD